MTRSALALALASALAPGVAGCNAGAATLAEPALTVGASRYHVDITNDGRAIIPTEIWHSEHR